MSLQWKITEWSGTEKRGEWSVPGALSDSEIESLLTRLVSRNLSIEEVISASLRRNFRQRTSHLDRVGRGEPISFGYNPQYTAERVMGEEDAG